MPPSVRVLNVLQETLDSSVAVGGAVEEVIIDVNEPVRGRKLQGFAEDFWQAFQANQHKDSFTHGDWKCDKESAESWKWCAPTCKSRTCVSIVYMCHKLG
jgi:hypothetical protein